MERKKPTAGIILAAGRSTRFGKSKQLEKLNGKPLVAWVIEAALGSRLASVVLVLGHDEQNILAELGPKAFQPRLKVVANPEYRAGMSQSLRVGLNQVRRTLPSVMFLLGDQPLLTAATINRLLENFWRSARGICVPTHAGQRGNPVIFSRLFYKQLLNLTGDMGARTLIESNPENVLQVEIEDPRCLLDVDTEEDLKQIQVTYPGAFST
ncbi:MAG: nucleotidyltransferase family protein [Desulfobacterales bacterium]|nr:nucleotidyltransferase family protein [Desulfobacterales bacterium]